MLKTMITSTFDLPGYDITKSPGIEVMTGLTEVLCYGAAVVAAPKRA